MKRSVVVTQEKKMAAMDKGAGDSYGGSLTSLPQGVNITNQPQPLDLNHSNGGSGSGSGLGCPHQARKIPISVVSHAGEGHYQLDTSVTGPQDCRQCGLDVASLLFQQLSLNSVVVADPQVASAPLQFRDVMVLTTQDTPISDVSGLVQGLRDARIPARVVMSQEEATAIHHSTYVMDEVLVLRRGLAGSDTGRRVMVLVESSEAAAEKMKESSLRDFAPLPHHTQHIVWVRQHAGLRSSQEEEKDSLDIEDIDDMFEDTRLLNAKKEDDKGEKEIHAAKDGRNHRDAEEEEEKKWNKAKDCDEEEDSPQIVGNGVVNYRVGGDNNIAREENYVLRDADRIEPVMKSSHRSYHSAGNKYDGGGGRSTVSITSSYGPNDCCDNFWLECCHDVGESDCNVCCPCCGELGNWCEACCRGFAHSLNDCLQSLLSCSCCTCDSPDCCSSSGGGGGCDCDCGGCDCDCGDCNCDCGSCDCVIM